MKPNAKAYTQTQIN